MNQQINLFLQLDREKTDWLTAQRCLQLCGAALLLVILMWVFSFYDHRLSMTELAIAKEDQEAVNAKLLDLQKQQHLSRQEDQYLVRIRKLQKLLAAKQQVLSKASESELSSEKAVKFSAFLRGLGEQHIEGFWFNRIHLTEGGKSLALTGRTQQPEYLPQYLQKLAGIDVFAGQRFSIFRMNLHEQTKVLDFEVRTSKLEAAL